MPVRFTITMTGEIDCPVYPADDLGAARENVGSLVRTILETALERRMEALGVEDGPMKDALLRHYAADANLARSLLDNLQIVAEAV
jgi:hypothetical protein